MPVQDGTKEGSTITFTYSVQQYIDHFVKAGGKGGALFSVYNIEGSSTDFVTVLWYGVFTGASVRTTSRELDRIAVSSLEGIEEITKMFGDLSADDILVDELSGDEFYELRSGENEPFYVNTEYIQIFDQVFSETSLHVWTTSYTDDSLIYKINPSSGTMLRISGDKLAAGDTIAYVPVKTADGVNVSANSDTVMLAFVYPLAVN